MPQILVQVAEGIPASQGGVPIPVEDYAYDEEGNRTASHLSALHVSNPHNQLTEDDRYTYAYDLKGNRTTRTEKATGAVETYTYDHQNRLIGYASPTTTATYAYDAIERRIAKTVNGATTAFVLDQAMPQSMEPSDIVLEFDAAGLSSRWVFSGAVDEPLAYETYSGSSTPGAGTQRELFANREGAISKVVDAATGSVDADYSYDSFGARTTLSGTLNQRYAYRGRELDAENGLYHQRWRTYDPASGTFLQMDPLGFGGGQENLYAYVDNDPFMMLDPMGLSAYINYRSMQHLGKQTLGAATRSVSAGAFGAVQRALAQMTDLRSYNLPPQTTGRIAQANNSSVNSNCGTNSDGQHVYAIYDGNTGVTLKVGVGNNKRLTANQTQSGRAIDQYAEARKFAGHNNIGHVVLIIIPNGFMARAQALIFEKTLVNILNTIGGGISGFHKKPKSGPFSNRTPRVSRNC